MRDRWFRKGAKNKYDPQIGEAAKANAAVAERSEQFNRDYFDKYVVPSLQLMQEETAKNRVQQDQLFNLSYDQAKLQDERYRTLGIPAEDRYYKMVSDYSAPEEQERQARAAIGDVRTAGANAAAQEQRRLRGLGIDPTSPLALSARTNVGLAQAAAEAGAGTRARDAAKALGMQLTSDAANFAKGGFSNTLAAGQAAGGASSAGLAGAQGSAQIAPGGASNVNQGLGLAQKAYGSNLDAYTSLGKTSMETYQSPLAGIGQLAGQLGAAYLGRPGSDIRMKKHTQRIVALAHGIWLWAFRYLWEPDNAPLRYGYMAHEVEPVFPDAVITAPNGLKFLDYGKVLV